MIHTRGAPIENRESLTSPEHSFKYYMDNDQVQMCYSRAHDIR